MKRYWKEIIFFCTIAAYYLYGLSPDMTWMSVGADQLSYVVAAKYGAPAGLSGNPLYILLGSLILHLPGNPFWVVGLLSALPAVGTCIVIYLIVRRPTTSKAAPYIASLVFASSFVVWSESVIVETYSITVLVMSLIIYFCFTKRYYWMGGMMLLAMGLHPLSIFAAIPCLIYAWWVEGKDFNLAGKIVGIALIGLLFRFRDVFSVQVTENTFYGQNPLQNILYSAGGYLGLSVIPIQPTLQRVWEDFVVLGSSLWTIPFVAVALLTKRKEYILLGTIGFLGFLFPFSSIYPQWIKYMIIPTLPIAILAGFGFDKVRSYTRGLVTIALVVCLVFMGLNVLTYSPGKTIDTQPTTARQFYNSLDELPNNTVIVGHTWGHPDLVIYYYCVENKDRISYINYNLVANPMSSRYYLKSLENRGIKLPLINLGLTNGEIPVISVEDFSKELQGLNPERSIYVTFVKDSDVPMVFSYIPSSEYSPWLNDLPPSKVKFSR